jgi:hypothetical protein
MMRLTQASEYAVRCFLRETLFQATFAQLREEGTCEPSLSGWDGREKV